MFNFNRSGELSLNFLNNIFSLALDAAFWLVIGLFIGGLFKTLIPTKLLQKHLSHEGFGAIIKAAILGAPLPLCSCGVIPAAMGLRQAGAAKSATTSFLVSTPETGVDSVFITYAMMGPFMAIVRPIVAVTSAITAGTLVYFFDGNDPHSEPKKDTQKPSQCCASKPQQTKKTPDCSSIESQTQSSYCASQVQQIDSCCTTSTSFEQKSFISKITSGVVYAFTDLLDNIIVWLVIGLIFAALIQTYVSHDFLVEYGTGWLGMLVMLVVGIPMYVCATASTPMAAGFLLAGISPGAVIVFLLAGPATNMATLGVISLTMGKRTMLLYLTGIMSIALISGFVVNGLVALWDLNINQHLVMNHQHLPQWLQLMSLLLLVGISLRKLSSKWLLRLRPQ